MKSKVEEAAQEYLRFDASPSIGRDDHFIAGARFVLEEARDLLDSYESREFILSELRKLFEEKPDES